MVSLVLYRPSEILGSLNNYRFSMLIEALGDHSQSARGVIAQIRKAQAALLSILHLIAEAQGGVDQMTNLVIDIPDKDPQRDAYLRSRETRSGSVVHGVNKILHQGTQLFIKSLNR
jgi:hypothetical protein